MYILQLQMQHIQKYDARFEISRWCITTWSSGLRSYAPTQPRWPHRNIQELPKVKWVIIIYLHKRSVINESGYIAQEKYWKIFHPCICNMRHKLHAEILVRASFFVSEFGLVTYYIWEQPLHHCVLTITWTLQ